MKIRKRHVRPSAVVLAMLTGVCFWVLAGSAVAQDAPSAVAPQTSRQHPGEFKNYRIKHIDAERVYQFLTETMVDPSAQIGLDDKENRLYVIASPETHAHIRELVEKLDIPPDSESVQVFELQHVDAVSMANTLADLGTRGINVSIDQQRNRLIVRASDAEQQMVEQLIEMLDRSDTNRDDNSAVEVATGTVAARVRAIWLATGPGTEAMDEPAEDLRDIVAELANIGITEVRQVGQAIVNTTDNSEFELSCSPIIGDGSAEWSIQGAFTLAADAQQTPRMKIQLAARNNTTAASKTGRVLVDTRTLAHLETLVTAPYGHFVVLCVAPAEEMTSLFVVQITRVD